MISLYYYERRNKNRSRSSSWSKITQWPLFHM